MSKIYGVDTTKDYTLVDIRNAIIECFTQAHKKILEQELNEFVSTMDKQNFERLKEMNVYKLVHDLFKKIGGDFNKPKKQDLISICDELAKIAKKYRGERIISKHYSEIMQLLEKITN